VSPLAQTRLSPEEEVKIVAAAAGGDRIARERLVEAFAPTIAGVARIYHGSASVTREELMQEGVCGLLRALERYDPELGTPFWAYASWWVRQAMQQLMAQLARPVVLSDRALRRLARLKEARAEHLQTHGGEPSTADLTEETGLTRVQIDNLLAIDRPPRRLEEPRSNEDGVMATVGELVADPISADGYERVIERSEMEEMQDLSAGLEEREREILFSHYGLGCPCRTLREIASGLELSVERVRQIEEKALSKLRDAIAV
jgi:RNA polymerase sigma factor (sigma-70 family)